MRELGVIVVWDVMVISPNGRVDRVPGGIVMVDRVRSEIDDFNLFVLAWLGLRMGVRTVPLTLVDIAV